MAAEGQSSTCCSCQFCERSSCSFIADFQWNVLSEKFYVVVTFGSEIPTCDRVEIGDVKRCSRWKELRKRYVFVRFYDNASVLPPGTKSYYIESEVHLLGFM